MSRILIQVAMLLAIVSSALAAGEYDSLIDQVLYKIRNEYHTSFDNFLTYDAVNDVKYPNFTFNHLQITGFNQIRRTNLSIKCDYEAQYEKCIKMVKLSIPNGFNITANVSFSHDGKKFDNVIVIGKWIEGEDKSKDFTAQLHYIKFNSKEKSIRVGISYNNVNLMSVEVIQVTGCPESSKVVCEGIKKHWPNVFYNAHYDLEDKMKEVISAIPFDF